MAAFVQDDPEAVTTHRAELGLGHFLRGASVAVVLLVIAGCSPLPSRVAVVTPAPTVPPPSMPTPTPWPVKSFNPYDMIAISSDGTWRVISPDGTSRVIDRRDVLGDRLTPSGLAGRVVTAAGAPVGRAVLVHHTEAGEPCSLHDVASITGPEGFFQASLLPGLCFVSAKVRGRTTAEVPVQIEKGRLTVVTLVMP